MDSEGGHEWTTMWRVSDRRRQLNSALVALDARHVWAPTFLPALLVSTANGGRSWRVSVPLRGRQAHMSS
jgi:hypothetical protein